MGKATSLGFRKTTTDASHLVAIGIAYVGGIKVRHVVKREPRSSVAHAVICQSGGMEVADRLPRARAECHHATAAHGSRLLIKWFANPESELASSAIFVYSSSSENTVDGLEHPFPCYVPL